MAEWTATAQSQEQMPRLTWKAVVEYPVVQPGWAWRHLAPPILGGDCNVARVAIAGEDEPENEAEAGAEGTEAWVVVLVERRSERRYEAGHRRRESYWETRLWVTRSQWLWLKEARLTPLAIAWARARR